MTRLAIIAVLLIGWSVGVYFLGRAHEIEKQTAAIIEAMQKRSEIDADVGKRDDYRLCLDLGGVPDKCNELRRLDPPAGSE